MILQDGLLETIMQWGFIIIIILILAIILIKWLLKKSFPSIIGIFYFAIPTYIVNTIIVASVGSETLNQYTIFELPTIALYLSPPLVWDALFAMGVSDGRIDLMMVATFFIVFLPIWIALKSSVGINPEKDRKYLKLKKLVSAWIIVTILGLGMSNFYLYILNFLITYQFLGIGLIFWISIAFAIILIILWWRKKRKQSKWSPENDSECQLINGEWVCPYD